MTTQLKVIALDPGQTTGYAIGLIENGKMGVTSGQEEWNHYALWSQLNVAAPDIIVCESFEFRNRARDNLVLYSLELIGVVKLYVQQRGRPPEHYLVSSQSCKLHMQPAAQGKGHFSDPILEKHELHRPAKGHANDAMRHLLHWFEFGSGYQYNTKGFEPLGMSHSIAKGL